MIRKLLVAATVVAVVVAPGLPTRAAGVVRVPSGSPSPAVQQAEPHTASGSLRARSPFTSTASWYCRPGRSVCTKGYHWAGRYAAAGPALRVGNWRGSYVWVGHAGRWVKVRLIDWCACPRGQIDLYASVFNDLAPLSRGRIAVTLAVVQ